jgi:DNA polymerase IV
MPVTPATSPPRPMTEILCQDCATLHETTSRRCPNCGSPRLIYHRELATLNIAHLDCDAFYAAIEKRDNPDLKDKPVIVGGRTRGVVSTACYIARTRGVKSAMPMFKALKLCPDAVVVRPQMEKYAAVGHEIRKMMLETTPLVEPVSIDEAFLDLRGTQRVHGHNAAVTLAALALRIENTIGITVSVGLAPNKFLAKVASDLQKPRGFSIIGAADAVAFLASRPVGAIYGVGNAMQKKLEMDGITSIAHLQEQSREGLSKKYGTMGEHLYFLARGIDTRSVSPEHETKSISAETTFDENLQPLDALEPVLWMLSERVSRRAKAKHLAGTTVTLKLKSASFKTVTRATTLSHPTLFAHQIFAAAQPLLRKEAGKTEYRLLGVGISNLSPVGASAAVPTLDATDDSRTKAEEALDRIRAKFGNDAIDRGLGKFRT